MPPLLGLVLLAGSAVVSALGAFLIGRGMRETRDDPAPAERIQRHRTRIALWVFLVSLVAPAAAALLHPAGLDLLGQGPVLLPFVVLALTVNAFAAMAGDFGTRRRLFDERWTRGEYLLRSLRFVVGFLGFWLALLCAPYAVHAAGAWGWAAGIALLAGLLAWSHHYPRIAMRIVKAQPLEDPELQQRFARVLERSTARLRPRVLVFGTERGGLANAFAVPARNAPHVVFTRPLLAALDADEATAIFAHEVAHHEEFEGALLRRMKRVEVGLVATACLLVPVLGLLGPWATQLALLGWMPAVFAALIARMKGMQTHETRSDIRAVEMTGDPEAVIRALTKVYALNRVPRRTGVEEERLATHPSLSRRIHAIREHAAARAHAAPAAAPARTELYASRQSEREVLALEPRKISWLTLPDGLDSSHWVGDDALPRLRARAEAERSVTYSGLVELRLVVRGNTSELRTVERSGARTRFPLLDDDLPRIQESLDRVDGQLAPVQTFDRGAHGGALALAFIAAFSAFLAMGQGVVTVGSALLIVLACLPTVLVRRRPWAAALGAMALVTAATQLLFPTDTSWWSSEAWAFLGAMGVAGFFLLARAQKPDGLREGSPAHVAAVFLLVGLPFLVVSLLALRGGDVAWKLYAWGLNAKGTFLPLVAAAGALWLLRASRVRIAAVVLCLAGVSHVVFGSELFLTNVVKDPLAVGALPELSVEPSRYAQVAETRLRGGHTDLRLAPGGRVFATRHGAHVVVSDFEGRSRPLDALRVAFVDDARLLALTSGDQGLELQVRSVTAPDEVSWRLALPSELHADDEGLDLAVRGVRWRVGRFGGTIGSADVARATRWLETRWAVGSHRWAEVLCGHYAKSELWSCEAARASKLVSSGLWVDFREPPPGANDALLIAHGPARARVWSAGVATGALAPRFQLGAHLSWTWDGRRLALLESHRVLLVDVATATASAIPLPRAADWRTGLAAAGDAVAVSWPEEDGVRVVLFAAPR